jgi:hypothetical protein
MLDRRPIFPALLLASLAPAALAQDVVTVFTGTASAPPGGEVVVPIRVRDRPNTPLDGGGPPGLTIRGIAVTVAFSPASAVESIEIVRGGLTEGLTPRFEAQVPGTGRHGWIVSFDADVPLVDSHQTVARLRLRLADDAPPGTTIRLDPVPETTALANAEGTLLETAGNGLLLLNGGEVEVSGGCTTETTLCLLDERFRVDVAWTDFVGNSGVGNAVQLTADSGYFWFFGEDNVEVVIKVLDGTAINGNVWVFYGSLSNVEFEITVTDGVSGAVKRYRNPSGRFASVGDTSAFPGIALAVPGARESPPGAIMAGPPKQAGCVADATHLCLLDGRFRLETSWRDFAGQTGVGRAVPLTDDAGYFWFFGRDNVEIVVKTLDGRRINGHFWVFYAALSNVEFTLKVTDTQTGAVREFKNPLGTFASVGETQAFPP